MNIVIPPFIELAETYGANGSNPLVLLTITVPCDFPSNARLSFLRHRHSFLTWLFGGQPRIQIGEKIFVDGTSATAIASFIREDDQLNEAIRILGFKFRLSYRLF